MTTAHNVNIEGLEFIARELIKNHKDFAGDEVMDEYDFRQLCGSKMVAAYAADAENSWGNGNGFEIGQYHSRNKRPVVCQLDDTMFNVVEFE